MTKKFTLTLIGLLLYFCTSAQVSSWVTKKPLGNDMTAREDAGMVSLNEKLYILGGYNNCGPKDFTEYDPATGTLRKLQPLGASCANPIRDRNLYAVKGKIYSISPYGTGVSMYDPAQDKWTLENSMAISDLIPDAGFVINDDIFLISKTSSNFYSYNIVTKTFTKKNNYPGSDVRGSIAFSINGKGYWGGGGTSSGAYAFYEYNPTTDTWTPKASLPYVYTYGSAIGHQGKGYAGLGESPAQKSQLWYEYDPAANTWTRKQNVMDVPDIGTNTPYRITKAGIAAIGDNIFIFGGSFGTNPPKYSDNLFQYNITTDNWQITNDELGGNRTEAAGFYANGKIYVGGGQDSESLDDFWEYDLATNNWGSKTSFPSTHAQRATVELNGKGYFIGGYDKNIPAGSTNQNYTEALLEYDPATNQWTAKAPFPGGKRTRMVALAYNGKIYAGMGTNANGSGNAKDFYEYDPVTNSWRALTNVPFETSDGSALSYFVLGDAAYVLTYRGVSATVHLFKYSFSTNSWQSYPASIAGYNTNNATNQAYVYNGKAYIVHGGNGNDERISEFNPANNTWEYVMNKPFMTVSKTIIPVPSGVYFGFGDGGSNNTYGTYSTNAWHELTFDMAVSQQVGVFRAMVGSISTPAESCNSYQLPVNNAHAIFDQEGKLFTALIANTATSGVCYEVNSLDTQQPYRTVVGKFDQAYSERVMFLNKSVLFKNNSGLTNGTKLRLYYTTAELNKFVQAFNSQYNTNKTINDIKILRYFENALNDHDPFNNKGIYYASLAGTLSNYGSDKYYEIESSGINGVYGELYAVLTMDATPPAPTVASPVTYCQNATATALTATGTALKWYATATTSTSLASAPVPGTTTVGTTSYWVTQTVEGVESPRAKIDVTVNPLPAQPTASGSWASSIVYGANTTFTVSAVTGATGYNWALPAGFEIVSGQNTSTVTVKATSGTATGVVSVRAVNNCGESTAYTRAIGTTKAAATVTISNLARQFDGTPKAVTVTTVPAGLTIETTYNGSATVPSAAGSYAVLARVVDNNYTGEASATLTISTVTATADLEEAKKIAVYPNPSTGKALLELEKGTTAYVTVTNVAGKVVTQTTVTDRHEINLETYAAGMYFVNVQLQGKAPVVIKLFKL